MPCHSGLTHGFFRLGGDGHLAAQRFGRRLTRILSHAPAPIQQHPFGPTQGIPDIAITRSLTGLARQLRKLTGKLFNHIVNAREVCFGTIQLQFSLVTAGIKPRNTGGFFKDTAPVLRFGVDQFRNLALAYQRWRMGSR